MKERLKIKLDEDDYCVEQLYKLNDKGCSFDQLWDNKLYSAVSDISYFTPLVYIYTYIDFSYVLKLCLTATYC
jgi:hypothetical protein